MRWLLIKLIHIYRYLLSPWVGNQCRFYPTCSNYAEQAIIEHGVLKGGYLMLRRLIKCNPWHQGGIDNVPQKSASSALANITTTNETTQSDSQATKPTHD